uniref:Tudor and KH domain-containing protein n=2 Tax=Callorhinchus milii TaxID=7868 RepID=V9KIL0_CALMI
MLRAGVTGLILSKSNPASHYFGERMTSGNPLRGLTVTQRVALAIGVSASAVAIYVLYKKYWESRDEECLLVGEDPISMDMRVPREVIKAIIGRQGSTIKQLRRDTGARIEVDDVEDVEDAMRPERIVTITGTPVQVCRAGVAIHQLLATKVQVTEELFVPQAAVGRIIGRGGENIRTISRNSGAKILCERERAEPNLDARRLIKITGTQEEVATAKALILDTVKEEEQFRLKLASSAATRRHRKHPVCKRLSPDGNSEGPECLSGHGALPVNTDANPDHACTSDSSQVAKFEIPSPDFGFLVDEYLEVYVSASENPNRFWIQILGTRCLQLDNLTDEMMRYYSGCKHEERVSARVGDIVAAPFQDDGCWYRARVLDFLPNGSADLYYVDYGDNGEVPVNRLQALRSDFLSLPFQAIECSLDRVQPIGRRWTEEALNEFDRLTHCAHWKILLAKICSYEESGGITRPHIQLFDKSSEKQTVDIAEELICLGHAMRCARIGSLLNPDTLNPTTTLMNALRQNDVRRDSSSETCSTGSAENNPSTSMHAASEGSIPCSGGVHPMQDDCM